MPFSSENGKGFIKWVVSKVPHNRKLDFGCGCGTYAKMFPGGDWTGVEVWKKYVEEYGLKSLYPKLYIQNALEFKDWEQYDIVFLGDILEHMEISEAKTLLDKAKENSDTVIVSIPIGYYPQDAYNGNPYEKHITDNWTKEGFIKEFGEPTISTIDAEIGVFVYSKHKIRPQIAVYAISKNEEKFVERFCKSCEDADFVLIADTGSTDGTVEKARECGATVHSIHISPWRFDLARNSALALVPNSIDICISLDLDEVMEPGWRDEIERIWEPGKTTNLWYLFDWGCGIRFPYHKIHSRHGYHWHHPCHEDIRIDARIKEVCARTDKLLVSHHPDPTKSRGQYMEILEVAVKEDDREPTHYFYYSRELTFYRRWEEAKVALQKYLSMDAASNQNERCYAQRLMAKCYSETGDLGAAERWLHQACSEAPNTREPWCELAMLMYQQQRWEECLAMSLRALKIKDKSLVYTCDPSVWGHWPNDLAAISAFRLELYHLAEKHGRMALGLSPEDERLKANLEYYMSALENKSAA